MLPDCEIYHKAKEILHITHSLVKSFDEKKDKLEVGPQMLENAFVIPAKVAGVESVEFYSMKMEKAILIKVAAKDLLASTSLCKDMGLGHKEHLQLLRSEIEEFRKLYISWVNSFDKTVDIEDDWA